MILKLARRRPGVALLGPLLAAGFCGLPNSASASHDSCSPPTKPGVVFVLDDSGSMKDSDPEDLRGVATGIGLNQLPDGAVVAASRFSDDAQSIFGPSDLGPTNRTQLRSRVSSALASAGRTMYDDAFAEAKRQLDAFPATVDKRAVVFLSDGLPTDSGYTADRRIAEAGVPIYTVGFGDASKEELGGIAARSGGQAFDVATAGEAQATFARIISILNCDEREYTDEVTLAPDEERAFPFRVVPSDREFRTLAAWSNGTVDVWLERPDGSRLEPGSEGRGETFISEPTYANAIGVDPPSGGWSLHARASADNVKAVNVTIDVFKREGLDPPLPADLIAPADGTQLSSTAATFSWHEARGARSYDLVVGDEIVDSDIRGTSARVTDLPPGAAKWYVIARNRYGGTPSERRQIGVPKPPERPAEAIPLDPTNETARAFMPLLFLDSDEEWNVLDVEHFFKDGQVQACDSAGTACESAFGDSLARHPSGSLLFDQAPTPAPGAMYVRESVQGAYRLLDYWWFFRYNRAPLSRTFGAPYNHHADWEGMTVAVPDQATSPDRFSFASIAAHDGAWSYLPGVLRCSDGLSTEAVHTSPCVGRRRINAYAARGSHATYPRRCGESGNVIEGHCDQTATFLPGVLGFHLAPDGRFDGRKPAVTTLNGGPLKTLSEGGGSETWMRWGGRWSRAGESQIQAPARQPRYQDPLSVSKCTLRWLRGKDENLFNQSVTCDPRFASASTTGEGCDRWFGPFIVGSVCDERVVESALANGGFERSGSARMAVEGGQSDDSPGLVQAAAAPLRPGQRLVVEGTAAPSAELRIRARVGKRIEEARFARIGLSGPEARVSVTVRGGAVVARTGSGRRLIPTGRRRFDFDRPSPPRSLRVRKSGTRLAISFESRAPRALVSVFRSGARSPLRQRALVVRNRGRQRVTFSGLLRPSRVAVVALNASGLPSSPASARVRPRGQGLTRLYR